MDDREAIRRVMQRYARAIDGRDHATLADLFDPEGEVVGSGGTKTVPDYLAGLREQPRTFARSMHVLGDPLIELDGGRATADTYAVVYQLDRTDGGGDLTLGMRYLDDLRLPDPAPAPTDAPTAGTGSVWRIVRRSSEILWMR